MTEVEAVNIEVYCDKEEGEKVVFAVVSEHRPDLPEPFNKPLQEWVQENFSNLEIGDKIPEAGEMVYEPNGEIVRFQKKATS